uniref:Uncharacterized protein n=1 Tax=Equus asinus TaxID=9793 RepID=A0A8C4LFN0_EQUAS
MPSLLGFLGSYPMSPHSSLTAVSASAPESHIQTPAYFPSYSPALVVFVSNDMLVPTWGPSHPLASFVAFSLGHYFESYLHTHPHHSSMRTAPVLRRGHLSGSISQQPSAWWATVVLCQKGQHTPLETCTLGLLWTSP